MNKIKKPDQLLDGWIPVSLGDIITLEYGKQLTEKDRNGEGYAVWGSNGIVGTNSEYLVKGPVIIIGRKGAVGTVHYSDENCWPIDTTYYIKPLNSVSLRYLYFLLHHLNLKNLDKSTTIPGLNRNNVYALNVLLPPVAEQQRIVSKIEELFSELEQSVKTLQKAKKELAVYKQAFFKKAFNGAISKKWREENVSLTADELVIRQLDDQFLLSGLSVIPKEWKWVTVDTVCNHIGSGSTPKGGRNVYLDEGIPFIRSQNVYPGILKTDDLVFISDEMNKRMKRTQIQENDVLLNITGASIDRCAYVPEGFGNGNVNQHVCIIRIGISEISHKYLCYYLNSPEAQIHINKINSGATREALTLEQIKSFPIPLCSYDEQILIVQELEYHFTMISNLEETIDNNLSDAELTRLSILKKAFEGNLVPQITDESIANYFEIIQQDKADYLLAQVTLHKSNPKRKKTMKEKLSIIEVLEAKKQPAPSSEVWQQSEFNLNIDEFYSALKELIEKNMVTEMPRKGKDSFLMLVSNEN